MKIIIYSLSMIILGLATLMPMPVVAFNGLFTDTCNNASSGTVCTEGQKPQTTTKNSIYGPDSVINNAVNIISIFIGIASVFMIIIGGFRYITSAGDANRANSARRTIIFSLLGVLVALFAQAMILFVLNKL